MATLTRLKTNPTGTSLQLTDETLPTLEQLGKFVTSANLLRPREHRGYSVYQVGERIIYKRYHFPLSRTFAPNKRAWDLEQAALGALAGLPGVPRAFGIQQESRQGEQFYHCLRERLPGQLIKTFTWEQAAQAGTLLASMHMRLVTTNDPQVSNFIQGDQGGLFFIDFGKASVFEQRSVRYYYRVARELFKFRYAGVKWDSRLWRIFLIHYYQGVDFNRAEKGIVDLCYGISYVRRYFRYRLRGLPM